MLERRMIGRRFVLVYVANGLDGLLGYIGLFAVARFTPNSEELLGLVGFDWRPRGGFEKQMRGPRLHTEGPLRDRLKGLGLERLRKLGSF